jgi:hypothetical protein
MTGTVGLLPVVTKSPSRFAVIGPGLPEPKLLIASGEDISDLIGYYSIREAGLESVFPSEPASGSPVLLDVFGGKRIRARSPYIAFDLWSDDDDGRGRSQLYSLVIDARDMPAFTGQIVGEFEQKLLEQLSRVVKAANAGSVDEVRYVGQMLSTFINLVVERLGFEQKRRERRANVVRAIMVGYMCVAVMLGIGVAVGEYFSRSGNSLSSVSLNQTEGR